MEIRKMIDSSLNYDNFVRRLHTWADYRLPEIEINGRKYPGSARLPGNLQNQEAIDYKERLYDGQIRRIIVEENDMNNKGTFYDEEGYLSLWLCKANSEQLLQDYVNLDYVRAENDEIPFQLGCDFNLWDSLVCNAF